MGEIRGEPVVKYVILEGFLLFHDERLVQLMDYMFWLEVPRDTCRFRRMITKRVPEEYFTNNIWPCYEKYRKTTFENEETSNKLTQIDGTMATQLVLQTALKRMGIEYNITSHKAEWFDEQAKEESHEGRNQSG